MKKNIIKIFTMFLMLFSFLGISYWDEEKCNWKEWCLTSNTFMVDTAWFWIWLWWWDKLETTNQKVNFALATIIEKLMIAMSSIALLVMIIGSAYIVLAQWKDEYVSRWRSIFIAWIIALLVALSSYFMVSFIRFILYSTQ